MHSSATAGLTAREISSSDGYDGRMRSSYVQDAVDDGGAGECGSGV